MASGVTAGGTGAKQTRRRLGSDQAIVVSVLLGSIAIGLYLRWSGLQYAEFNYDQAWSLGHAFDFAKNGIFPSVGIRSSIGTYQGPMEHSTYWRFRSYLAPTRLWQPLSSV